MMKYLIYFTNIPTHNFSYYRKYWDIWESNKDYLIAICRNNTLPNSFTKIYQSTSFIIYYYENKYSRNN